MPCTLGSVSTFGKTAAYPWLVTQMLQLPFRATVSKLSCVIFHALLADVLPWRPAKVWSIAIVPCMQPFALGQSEPSAQGLHARLPCNS